ncbi:MAG: LytTR family DNA-binding domain-containing protein [Ginsengibacter sp.]
MKIVIIEDELLAAEDLSEILLKLSKEIQVTRILYSVKEAVEYFRHNRFPDLIFCDIQLGDGYSFEIFRQVKLEVPVIFCTAYNQYALEAFKNNGIDYILKPFTSWHIKEAIEKYNILKQNFVTTAIDYTGILKILQSEADNEKRPSSILVNFKEKIIPIKISDIAVFNIDHKITQLTMFNNQKFYISHALDELESFCGHEFYRANRQYLINRQTIQEAQQSYSRKLTVKLKVEGNHEVIISKNKASEFLNWLRN